MNYSSLVLHWPFVFFDSFKVIISLIKESVQTPCYMKLHLWLLLFENLTSDLIFCCRKVDNFEAERPIHGAVNAVLKASQWHRQEFSFGGYCPGGLGYENPPLQSRGEAPVRVWMTKSPRSWSGLHFADIVYKFWLQKWSTFRTIHLLIIHQYVLRWELNNILGAHASRHQWS